MITPTYNEADNLTEFLNKLFQFAPLSHVLVVDDNSPDGTGELAKKLSQSDPRIHVMHRAAKLGIGSAYIEGFRWGLAQGYEFLAQMDTDLSHDPQYLPSMFRTVEGGADLVLGSRNVPGGEVEGWGLGRHVLSKGGSLYSRAILNLPVHDLTSGYKIFRRSVLETIPLDAIRSEGYSFQIETTFRAIHQGFKVVEVPITFVDRRAGQSKMSRNIFLEAVAVVWKLKLDALTGKLEPGKA